jgi:hypothetical protein
MKMNFNAKILYDKRQKRAGRTRQRISITGDAISSAYYLYLLNIKQDFIIHT